MTIQKVNELKKLFTEKLGNWVPWTWEGEYYQTHDRLFAVSQEAKFSDNPDEHLNELISNVKKGLAIELTDEHMENLDRNDYITLHFLNEENAYGMYEYEWNY